MGLRSGLTRRLAVLREFYGMVRDRRIYILAPLLAAVAVILLFLFISEMPVLIPFFYAVF